MTMARACQRGVWILGFCFITAGAIAREPDRIVDVWPAMAPGETTKNAGTPVIRKTVETPVTTRIGSITHPTLSFYEPPADKKNGAVVLICPGGGYNYVVVDKEGSEAAEWLNAQGITAVVLRYRTKDMSTPVWKRPLQDAQRAMSLLRSQAAEQKYDTQRIGILGFSAGGHLAALTSTHYANRSYTAVDAADTASCRPDFSLLIYPWRLLDDKTQQLSAEIPITAQTPPTFLVHTHDDGSTSLGPVWFYARLKELKIPAELHVYQAGGHGYGLRPVNGTAVHKWIEPAQEWLKLQKIVPTVK
jgi:acetyl esterase/lipase